MIKHIQEHRAILSIAIPMVLSNITVPLLGLVDTAVIGHLPGAYYLGGVAVGSMIVTLFLWLSGFLRMATTGLTAQAYGAQSNHRLHMALSRGLTVSFMLGLLFIVLQVPIIETGLLLAGGSEQVSYYAAEYAYIRIWSFPASLANLVFIGWFLGLHRARVVMWLLILTNVTNLLLDLLFVWGFHWNVAGIAWATLIADYSALFVALVLAIQHLKSISQPIMPNWSEVLYWNELSNYLKLNRDILIRTICLEICFAFIVFQGARMGDIVVAANAILMNFLMLISFGLDGIAYGAEARVGRAKGAKDFPALQLSVRLSLYWTGALALLYSLFFFGYGSSIVDLISSNKDVNLFAEQHMVWIVFLPIIACWCYLFDGVYIGLTKGAEMRNSMLFATVFGFFPCWFLLQPFGNHALWGALVTFMAARGLTLGFGYYKMGADVLN